MSFSGLIWVTSWISCVLASSQVLWKVPDYFTHAFPTRAFSVASSPLEIPSPFAFSTSGYSDTHTRSSKLPLAAVSNLGIQIGAGISPPRPQPRSTAVRPTKRTAFAREVPCYPEAKLGFGTVSSTTFRKSVSTASQTTSARSQSKGRFPRQLLQAVQNLFSQRQRIETKGTEANPRVRVVSARTSTPQGEQKQAKQGLWKYSQFLTGRAIAAVPSTDWEGFQVWVKGHLVAHLPKQSQANLMAERLRTMFADPADPDLNASPVEPKLVDGQPAVTVGDRLLLVVDDALERELDRNRELLAIEWANNLRIALGKTPLALAEAQQRMHNLSETPTTIEGIASWYGPYFHGRLTATGEVYDQNELTAAHPSLPFDTYLRVRNLENDNTVIVRINDRGPYIEGRTLDLSKGAARCLNSLESGVVPYEATIMEPSAAPEEQYLVNSQY
jgi:rare lipoprotein A